MNITLAPVQKAFVDQQVRGGRYVDASEVVRGALLDSLSELGEMESLRLQMAMDRLSKMMSTLSNLLQKVSDTSSSIIQNIK